MGLATRLAAVARGAADVLFPPSCPLCRADTAAENLPCPACWSEIAFLHGPGCHKCGRPIPGGDPDDALWCDDCLRYSPAWQRGAAVLQYSGAGRRLVLALKHGDRLDMVPMLAGWLRRSGQPLIDAAEIIAPVPLHWTRRLQRRFNQAAVLARALDAGGGPGHFAPRLLARTRPTPSQDGRDRAARAANVAGVFEPGPEMARAHGKRVLLIDDVLTTGATLNEAARTCLAHGTASVDILVLALVVRDETTYMARSDEDKDPDDEAS